ncbi:helix-turn-helix domain-containing protein [Actinophytocola sp.]|uniref:helix-turn-helix domain-containing protein n=1 Tax=Actinophytocola sp. TaxID=1872138 RepID=UPI002ED38C43
MAAPGNRRALVAAAREVFADAGFDAPLSAVTKKAGVGQGSLYRHFPDRISLAIAVFEDNVAELEAVAADPSSTLDDLVALITERTTESVAFVDMVTPARDDPRIAAIVRRVEATIASSLRRARRTGEVRRSVRTADVMLAVSLVAALVAKTPAEQRRRTADHAWSLLWHALRP